MPDLPGSDSPAPPVDSQEFTEATGTPGSFMRPQPQPVEFTGEFRQNLERLAKEVAAAVKRFGPTGEDYR